MRKWLWLLIGLLVCSPAWAQSTVMPVRLNSGGPAFTDGAGNAWQADGFFFGTSNVSTTTSAVNGTTDDALYQTERWGANWSYQIPVTNGPFRVTLHFAEIAFTAAGQRVFDVSIEGKLVLDNLDLVVTAKPLTAYVQTFTTTVADGVLNIALVASVNNAQLAAVEIAPLPTSYRLRVYRQGAPEPPVDLDILATAPTCDLAPTAVPAPPVINPRSWRWDDPSRPGRECLYDDQARFDALSDGQYEAAVASVGTAGVGPESPHVPFGRLRPQPPPAPTGVKVTQ